MTRFLAIVLVLTIYPTAGTAVHAQDSNSPLTFHDPQFSPDGDHIFFYSNRDERENFEIYSMRFDTGKITRLTENPAYDGPMDVSPDGSLVAFGSKRSGPWEIYLMNTDGSDVRRVTQVGGANDPAFSPDGTRIAFTRSENDVQNIFVMDADGSNMMQLTDNPAPDHSPTWTPDGQTIVFVSARTGAYHIHAMDTDGANVRDISESAPGIHQVSPDVAPDGTRILFTPVSGPPGNEPTMLHTMAMDGSDVRQITPNYQLDAAAGFAPDGRQIVYLLDEGDGMAIFVANADGTGVRRITNP